MVRPKAGQAAVACSRGGRACHHEGGSWVEARDGVRLTTITGYCAVLSAAALWTAASVVLLAFDRESSTSTKLPAGRDVVTFAGGA